MVGAIAAVMLLMWLLGQPPADDVPILARSDAVAFVPPMQPAPAPLLPTRTEGQSATVCDGPLRVLDAEGRPAGGARVEANRRMASTDPHGVVDWPGRPCGTWSVVVRADDVQYPPFDVEVEGPGSVTLQLPPDRVAVVVAVDLEGHPANAWIERRSEIRPVEVLGVGRWRIVAPREEVNVCFRGDWASERCVVVPLDNAEHTVVLGPQRRVEVEGYCGDAGCPDLSCDYEPCQRFGPNAFLCPCPDHGADLHDKRGRRAGLPDDARWVRFTVPTDAEADPSSASVDVIDRVEPSFVPLGGDGTAEGLGGPEAQSDPPAADAVETAPAPPAAEVSVPLPDIGSDTALPGPPPGGEPGDTAGAPPAGDTEAQRDGE